MAMSLALPLLRQRQEADRDDNNCFNPEYRPQNSFVRDDNGYYAQKALLLFWV
jgi:hypothetical protein